MKKSIAFGLAALMMAFGSVSVAAHEDHCSSSPDGNHLHQVRHEHCDGGSYAYVYICDYCQDSYQVDDWCPTPEDCLVDNSDNGGYR